MWQPISIHNKQINESGFTLIELLVAIVIMLVGLLGLMYSVEIAMQHNMKNQMRGEVVRIAEEAMSDMRSRAFGFAFKPTTTVNSSLRNINRSYTITRSVIFTGTSSSRKYQVDVKWVYKNVSTTHSIVSIRSR